MTADPCSFQNIGRCSVLWRKCAREVRMSESLLGMEKELVPKDEPVACSNGESISDWSRSGRGMAAGAIIRHIGFRHADTPPAHYHPPPLTTYGLLGGDSEQVQFIEPGRCFEFFENGSCFQPPISILSPKSSQSQQLLEPPFPYPARQPIQVVSGSCVRPQRCLELVIP